MPSHVRVGIAIALAFAILSPAGCKKKRADDGDNSGTASSEWKADPAAASQLADDYEIEGYTIRPPKGYSHREQVEDRGTLNLWYGPERADRTTASFVVRMATIPPGEALPSLDEVYKLGVESIRKKWAAVTISPPADGKIGGVRFLRADLSGTYAAGTKPMRGFTYLAQDNRTRIMIHFQDLDTNAEGYRVAQAAALSFRKADPKPSRTTPDDAEDEPPPRPVARAKPRTTPAPVPDEDSETEPPVVARPVVPPQPAKELPAGTMIGFPFAAEFKEPAPKGGLLVGFEVGYGQFAADRIVWGVRPIYRADGKDYFGAARGKGSAGTTTLKAKPGYAVAGLKVKSRHWVEGFSVVYMKVDGDRLDPNDSYESAWVGWDGDAGVKTLGGSEKPVVGLIGRTDPNQNALAAIGLMH